MELENAGASTTEGAASAGASTQGAASGETVTQAQQGGEGQQAQPTGGGLSPELTAAIAEATKATEERIRKEYEDKGGHMAKLKSKYDSKIAALEKQVRGKSRADLEEAKQLLEQGDPVKAARILSAQVETQLAQSERLAQQQEMRAWASGIMTDLGVNLDADEEAAEFTASWLQRIEQDPNEAWNFHQAAAKRRLEQAEQRANAAEKQAADLRTSIPAMIQAEITKTLAAAGLTPDPTGQGTATTPAGHQGKSRAQLMAEGIAARRAAVNQK